MDLIGSFAKDMRETGDPCGRGRSIPYSTCVARWGSSAAGSDKAGNVRREVTLFKSVGTALEDLAGAELAYDSATEKAGWL